MERQQMFVHATMIILNVQCTEPGANHVQILPMIASRVQICVTKIVARCQMFRICESIHQLHQFPDIRAV